MTSQKRRAAGRRRAWGRGPIILRFEPLEDRQLLAAQATPLPDLVGADFATAHNLDWGQSFHAVGTILNQGDAATTAPFNVAVYASNGTTISSQSVELGVVTIPAGLGPNQTAQFDQVFTLPPTAIPNYTSGNLIYIDLFTNGNKAVPESNYRNNEGVGQGFDSSPVVITPQQPSLLQGSAFGVTPSPVSWGQTVNLTAQIRNNAQGDAPATRARLVLTPSGLNPGSAYDYTIGYINIPAIPAWQTINISQQVTLPAAPPSSLTNDSQFTLSLSQDADFVTNPIYPHLANQGSGLDMTSITINPPVTTTSTSTSPTSTSSSSASGSSTSTPTPTATTPNPATLPDLAPANVVAPTKPIYWGYSFQVSATIQNLGQGDSGPVNVDFLLTGTNGSVTNSIFLGNTTVPALQHGTSINLTQTLNLPNTLPNGVTIPSSEQGRIAVLVDPDHTTDETLRSNSLAESAPVVLRVIGTDGSSTVPTSPPISTTLGSPQPAGAVQPIGSPSTTQPAPAAPASPAAKAARQGHTLKLHRQTAPKRQSVTSRIEHQILAFPGNVKKFFNNVVGNSTSSSKPKPKKKAT